mmetsp:Transcript_100615/g.280272  ORF Transcript_100615/g.280272 Transcript_100615/m.280272 type:complete len:96 (-) Transcript_100615:69-356(-)
MDDKENINISSKRQRSTKDHALDALLKSHSAGQVLKESAQYLKDLLATMAVDVSIPPTRRHQLGGVSELIQVVCTEAQEALKGVSNVKYRVHSLR